MSYLSPERCHHCNADRRLCPNRFRRVFPDGSVNIYKPKHHALAAGELTEPCCKRCRCGSPNFIGILACGLLLLHGDTHNHRRPLPACVGWGGLQQATERESIDDEWSGGFAEKNRAIGSIPRALYAGEIEQSRLPRQEHTTYKDITRRSVREQVLTIRRALRFRLGSARRQLHQRQRKMWGVPL